MSKKNLDIGEYIIFYPKIGKGAFSKVYKAKDKKTNEDVAIKIINKKILNDDLMQRINSEIKIMRTLEHQHIIKFKNAFSISDYIFIVTDLYPLNLRSIIKFRRPESDVRNVMVQIKNGLQYLINKKIYHRDLKPENLLLTADGVIKIADFGLSKSFETDNQISNTFCGTPLYMAPECINNQKYHLLSDLWSLGIILYELLFNQLPHGNSSNMIDLKRKINMQICVPWEIDHNCRDLLSRLLTADPNRRITWDEFFMHPWLLEINVKNINVESVKNINVDMIDININVESVKNINVEAKKNKDVDNKDNGAKKNINVNKIDNKIKKNIDVDKIDNKIKKNKTEINIEKIENNDSMTDKENDHNTINNNTINNNTINNTINNNTINNNTINNIHTNNTIPKIKVANVDLIEDYADSNFVGKTIAISKYSSTELYNYNLADNISGIVKSMIDYWS